MAFGLLLDCVELFVTYASLRLHVHNICLCCDTSGACLQVHLVCDYLMHCVMLVVALGIFIGDLPRLLYNIS